MTFSNETEKIKAEIKVLQKKLDFLEELEKTKSPVEESYKDWWGQYPELETDSEYDDMRWAGFQAGFQAAYEEKVREDDYYNEVETHKSQPKMEFYFGGKFEVVSYNEMVYYRLEFTNEVYWYKKDLTIFSDSLMLVRITDGETRRLLEGVWFNDVKKGKYDADEPYRNVKAYWDEKDEKAYWGEKDNPKPMDDVVNMLVKKYQYQKLYNRVRDQLGYSIDCCDEIVDLVEDWLPKEQSAAGSQNVDTELLVEGFNDAIRKMKEMLR